MPDELDLRFLDALKQAITQGEKRELMLWVINNPDAAMAATEAIRKNIRVRTGQQSMMATP